MADINPPPKTVSLDELLKTNKEQFDAIFSMQMENNGLIGTNHLPPTLDEVTLPSITSSAITRPTAPAEMETRPPMVVDRPAATTSPSAVESSPGFEPPPAGPAETLDPITLDLIENALRNARHEMDAVLFRSAMSPVIREQHDEFPMITDASGRMIVGTVWLLRGRDAARAKLRAFPRRCDPAKRSLSVRRCGQPHQRLDGVDSHFPCRPAGGVQLHVRSYDGCRGSGPGQHANRGHINIWRGFQDTPAQGLRARQSEPGGARPDYDQHPYPGDELQRPDGHHCRVSSRRKAGHRDL